MKKLISYVDVSDNTPIQQLSVLDQLRVLIKKMSHDDYAELEADNATTTYELQLQADLSEVVEKAITPLRKGNARAVSISIPNRFEPVLDQYLTSSGINKYYKVKIHRPKIDYNIEYKLRLDLEVM